MKLSNNKLIFFIILPVFILLSSTEICFRILYDENQLIFYLNTSNNDNYYWLTKDRISRVISRNTATDQNTLKIKKLIYPTSQQSNKFFQIAVIGASSAVGYPYAREFAFPNLLRIMLAHLYPDIKIVVYNLAVFAQTYNFGLRAAQSSTLLKPDIIIVYAGHNERYAHNFIQVHRQINRSYLLKCIDSISFFFERYSIAFKWALDQRDKLRDTEIKIPPTFNSNNHIDEMLQNYRMLTDELVQIARKYEIKLIFSTLIRNIRDYPPRKYDGTIDLAFPPMSPQEYKSHKEDQKKDQSNMWRLARWYDNNGNKEKANTLYTKVSDLAYGIGRIHSQLQEYIRGIHKIYPDVDCVDVEKDIQKIFDTKSLGNDAIIDWVHPKVETNYYIARSMLFAINPTLERRFGKRKYSIPDFQTVLYEAHPHAEVLKANGLVEGGFTNLGGLGPDIAKKLFLEGLKNRPSSEYQAKAFIGLALIALREKDRKTLSDMISRLKKLNTNIIRANLYHYRGFKEIMKIHSLLKIDEE